MQRLTDRARQTLDVASLPVGSGAGASPRPPSRDDRPPASGGDARDADIFATIERLAGLQAKGILSAEEFAAKKSELLGRL